MLDVWHCKIAFYTFTPAVMTPTCQNLQQVQRNFSEANKRVRDCTFFHSVVVRTADESWTETNAEQNSVCSGGISSAWVTKTKFVTFLKLVQFDERVSCVDI